MTTDGQAALRLAFIAFTRVAHAVRPIQTV